ncbi:MAG: hypothetical protein J0L76_02715 [Rhodobacterales bacterium]|nr:hypothetical protein [Rhodobacterales bacterium]
MIAEADDRNPLAQLLRAANETMLGRSLQFDSAGGPSLTVDVSGRRILRLTSAIGLTGAESCLGVEVLEDEHKDDLIKLLRAVAAPRHALSVTSGPIGRGGEEVSVGLPVALLADLVLIDLNDLGEEDAAEDEVEAPLPAPPMAPPVGVADAKGGSLAGFATAVGPELVAWLVSGGDDDGRSSGPEEMVSHLQGFLDDERSAVDDQLDALSSSPGEAVCVMLGATLVEGHCVVCARVQSGLLLGVIEGDGTGAVLQAWRGVWT